MNEIKVIQCLPDTYPGHFRVVYGEWGTILKFCDSREDALLFMVRLKLMISSLKNPIGITAIFMALGEIRKIDEKATNTPSNL